jgi:hypothetical protein
LKFFAKNGETQIDIDLKINVKYDILNTKGKSEKRPTLNSITFYPLWAAVTIAVVAAIFCP